MERHTLEMIFVIIGLSFWVLFPIGTFLTMYGMKKSPEALTAGTFKRKEFLKSYHFDWHHPFLSFRRRLH